MYLLDLSCRSRLIALKKPCFLERLAAILPEQVNLMAISAASTYLSSSKSAAKATSVASDEPDSKKNKESRLPAFILACSAFGDDCPIDVKERLLWDWILVAHHPGPCESI